MLISYVYTMLRKRCVEGVPLRIIYLADFDGAGSNMPIMPARHIEHAIRLVVPKPYISLTPVALTTEQVEAWDVPRKMLTEKDLLEMRRSPEGTLRKENYVLTGFMSRHGQPAELNALVSPRLKERFRQFLSDTIRKLRGPRIREKVREARTLRPRRRSWTRPRPGCAGRTMASTR